MKEAPVASKKKEPAVPVISTDDEGVVTLTLGSESVVLDSEGALSLLRQVQRVASVL